ncbi:MAG: FecR domain-containing protein [Prevotellaceae bacterium]|jgi:ferric-dicitrate binding protein FerR (iron transport regulator)|nr:FecR domain-containing protein [Prevotellaceae bacterium]
MKDRKNTALSNDNQKRLQYLLSQYMGRRIKPEELSELQTMVNLSDDEVIDEHLHDIWMNDEYVAGNLNKRQEERIIGNIIKKTAHYSPAMSAIHILARVAAVILFGLLSLSIFYLYRANQRLSIYNNSEIVLNVGNGQEAEYILPDGTSVRLNAGSTLRHDNDFGENLRQVNFSGEAFFDVKQNEGNPFIVSTKHLNIEVVGTSFNIYAFDNGDLVEMTLLAGSVKAISRKNPNRYVVIKPNEKVICDVSTGALKVQETNAQYETAWLNGEIVFKSETLSKVLIKLERKYGVHFRYEGNPELLNDRFTGRISKDNNIGDAMKILTQHYSLKYEQKDGVFVLSSEINSNNF